MLADVIDEERTDCSTIIGRSDCAITFLTRSVPNLRLDCLCVNLNGSRGKFDANGGLGVKVELVASEAAQQVGFPDSGVTNENDW
jgi:hypothetical protein